MSVELERPVHGRTGKLVNLISDSHSELLTRDAVVVGKDFILNERQVCDLELLMNGGFSPLETFMDEPDYRSVVDRHRLIDGTLFGLPVTLDSDDERICVGDFLKLTSPTMGGLLAIMRVDSKYDPDRRVECQKVYGTTDPEHPSVHHLLTEKKRFNLSGKIFGLKSPARDWVSCKTPRELREEFAAQGNRSTVAFQCRNPIHRAHAAMFTQVARSYGASVVVHPIVGPTKSDDFSARVRKDTYETLKPTLKNVSFEYLPYNMMVGGPRECLQHLLIRKNYGFSHMIVGRDHAGCKNKKGIDYYGPYDAQEFVSPLQDELQIKIIPFLHMVYIPEKDDYFTAEEAREKGWNLANISGTEFRGRIMKGEEVPPWFAFPEVVSLLREHYGPKDGAVLPDSAVPQIA